MRRAALGAATAILVAACSAGGGGGEARHSPHVRLVKVATLDQPLALATRPGDPTLYVAEKTGKVVAIGNHNATTVLDISRKVSLGGEQGLLGLTFSPDGRSLYVDYTDVQGNTRVVEYAFRHGRAAVRSARQLLFVHQPFSNHNGGEVIFGPDGMLYVGLGDGGSGGDPFNNAQSLDTLLGKILRIDPRPQGSSPYSVPPDNPFVGVAGARPEIWAYGLRNPWRFSFDRLNGDLWIGDVGQSSWEEVDHVAAGPGGQNYGWNRMEGDHSYNGTRAPPGAVAPVYEYPHANGDCVVTGGYVYRGRSMPGLRGEYVFADFCSGLISALRHRSGQVVVSTLGATLPSLSSFGEGRSGELYAMSLSGGLYRLAPAA